jgi:hypothetical protein
VAAVVVQRADFCGKKFVENTEQASTERQIFMDVILFNGDSNNYMPNYTFRRFDCDKMSKFMVSICTD